MAVKREERIVKKTMNLRDRKRRTLNKIKKVDEKILKDVIKRGKRYRRKQGIVDEKQGNITEVG